MTKRDQIIELALRGVRPAQIAADTGIQLSTVYTTVCKARRNGHPIPEFPRTRNATAPTQELRFTIDHDVARVLAIHATARNTTPGRLAKELINIIAEDGLVGSVLDD